MDNRRLRVDRLEQARVRPDGGLRQAEEVELGQAALRTHMPGLGRAMIPARRLERVAQRALAFEKALADDEGRFRVARLGGGREQQRAHVPAPSPTRRSARARARFGEPDAKRSRDGVRRLKLIIAGRLKVRACCRRRTGRILRDEVGEHGARADLDVRASTGMPGIRRKPGGVSCSISSSIAMSPL